MDSKTIIILLSIIIVLIYIYDMYNKEGFKNYRNNESFEFADVDYNTTKVICDNLTGTNNCIINTVKPDRKIVCNKNLLIENKSLDDIDIGMSMDQMDMLSVEELDKLNIDQMSMDQMNINKMNIDIKRQYPQQNISINEDLMSANDMNTLSDIEEQI
jgi:hypothetical protein